MALDDTDLAILTLEKRWWLHAGAKEQEIVDTFGMPTTAYYARLNALIDTAQALEHDPVLVHRLRRMRAERARQRSPRPRRLAV